MLFDGSDDILSTASFNLVTGCTVFAVVARTWNTDKYAAIFVHGYADTSGQALAVMGSAFADWLAKSVMMVGDGFNSGRAPRVITTAYAPTNGTFHLLAGGLSASRAVMRIDGAAHATNTVATGAVPSTTATAEIGSNSFGDDFDGHIAELLVYNAAVSTADWQQLEHYLNTKYALYSW